MSDETRQQLLEVLTQRLEELDTVTLQQLEKLTQPPSDTAPDTGGTTNTDRPSGLSRRQFLTGALVGGGTGLVVAAGGGFAALMAAKAETRKLFELLSLYEALERVDLDAVVEAGLSTVAGLLDGIESGVLIVKRGVEVVEDALNAFTGVFPTIRSGIAWVEKLVSSLSDKLASLEEAIGSVVERVSPITDALGEFFNFLLGLLPDSIETPVRDTLARVEAVITSIPEAVEGINTHLLAPLREHWFGDEAAQRLETTLIEPITTGLLDPLEAHLSAWANLLNEWEAELAHPVRETVQERQAIRAEIAQYREQSGLV